MIGIEHSTESNSIARNILSFRYGMHIAASAKRFSCFHEIDQIDMGYAVSFLQEYIRCHETTRIVIPYSLKTPELP